jgi:hypothetical protein
MPVAVNRRNDRGIAALGEAAARAGLLQPGQLLTGEDRDQLVADGRRLQPGYRVGQLVFGGQPFEELAGHGTGDAVVVADPGDPVAVVAVIGPDVRQAVAAAAPGGRQQMERHVAILDAGGG